MPDRRPDRKPWTAVRVVSYVLAAIFVCAGLVKLWNAQMVAEQFAAWNYPPSFLYLVGCVEVLAGLLLITASARAVGAVLLGILMIGAAATHFLAQQWSAIAVPAVVLAVLVWIAMSSPIRFVSPAEHGTPRTSL